MPKFEMSEDDTEAAEESLEAYAAWVRESKRNRPKGHPESFFHGFYYGLAHARGKTAATPPPDPPEETPVIPDGEGK